MSITHILENFQRNMLITLQHIKKLKEDVIIVFDVNVFLTVKFYLHYI